MMSKLFFLRVPNVHCAILGSSQSFSFTVDRIKSQKSKRNVMRIFVLFCGLFRFLWLPWDIQSVAEFSFFEHLFIHFADIRKMRRAWITTRINIFLLIGCRMDVAARKEDTLRGRRTWAMTCVALESTIRNEWRPFRVTAAVDARITHSFSRLFLRRCLLISASRQHETQTRRNYFGNFVHCTHLCFDHVV